MKVKILSIYLHALQTLALIKIKIMYAVIFLYPGSYKLIKKMREIGEMSHFFWKRVVCQS